MRSSKWRGAIVVTAACALTALLLLMGAQAAARRSAGSTVLFLPFVRKTPAVPPPTIVPPTATTRPVEPTATAIVAPPTATSPPVGGANYSVHVGPGYTDVSPRQLIRTSGDRLYVAASNCENYPCTDVGQTLRMFRAISTGVPSGFSRADQQHEPRGVVGWAIAVDRSNVIHVAWTDRIASGSRADRLRYTTFNPATDTWSATTETIDDALNVTTESGGQGVQTVALALDANGSPHIVYLKRGPSDQERRIVYRSRSANGWSAPVRLDDTISYSGNQKAWHPNLLFDTQGRILALWERGSSNGGNDGTIFGRVRAANGAWGGAVNISGENAARVTIDQSTSAIVTPDNRYHVTWITSTNDFIRYQYSDDAGISWKANHPGGGMQPTHNPALGWAAGKLRIYGHGSPVPPPDGSGDNLYYFESAGGSAAWSGWTQLVTGDFDSSVNVRWSQYFHNFPNTIDLAYWNDAYPNELYVGSEVR